MEKWVKKLIEFITNTKEFKFLDISTSYNYATGDSFSLSANNSRNLTNNNMGATIIDGILQAGLNYNNVVKPRVDEFKNQYRNIRTTSQFFDLISKNDLSELIRMKGQKVDRIHTLVNFLKKERIETEDDFYIWLSNSDNLLTLAGLKGIKSKTIDYFKILTGHKETIAIDIRLLNFIKISCPELGNLTYEQAKELLMKTAKGLKVEPATLDFSIWTYMGTYKREVVRSSQKVELDQVWNGYCPESFLQGKRVRMRLNRSDFYESEETGLQICVLRGLQAIILNHRGEKKFSPIATYGDEIEMGELLSPQNFDKRPFNKPAETFNDSSEIEEYIFKIK